MFICNTVLKTASYNPKQVKEKLIHRNFKYKCYEDVEINV